MLSPSSGSHHKPIFHIVTLDSHLVLWLRKKSLLGVFYLRKKKFLYAIGKLAYHHRNLKQAKRRAYSHVLQNGGIYFYFLLQGKCLALWPFLFAHSGKGLMKILGGHFSKIVISTKHPEAKQVQSSNGTSLPEACKYLTCGSYSSFYTYYSPWTIS